MTCTIVSLIRASATHRAYKSLKLTVIPLDHKHWYTTQKARAYQVEAAGSLKLLGMIAKGTEVRPRLNYRSIGLVWERLNSTSHARCDPTLVAGCPKGV
jgi:hypothetical protein